MPRSRAPVTTFGPSRTNARSASRAPRSRSNARSRLTSGCRAPSDAGSGTSRGFERLAGRRDQRAERGVVAYGEVREDLAVDLDVGGLQSGDETRVRDVVLAARGVDPDDPEPAELALAGPAIAERVVAGVHHLLVGLAQVTAP